MKITGIDGKYYSWHPSLSTLHPKEGSRYHILATKLLKELFPFDNIYEEVILPGSGNSRNLIADFVIPAKKIVVEVQGEQHYQKTFFHKTKLEFQQAQLRDTAKARWCQLNGLTLITLPYMETIDEWKSRFN